MPDRMERAFLAIYRASYEHAVFDLVQQAEAAGCRVRLWALERCIQSLAPWTCGEGRAPRLTLLNRLARSVSTDSLETLVVSDDDVQITRGTLRELIMIAERGRFGLAQPAHDAGSHVSHVLTRRQYWTRARTTTFVEVGPLVVISRPWIERVLPFPESYGMGWALDLAWTDLRAEGCRMGIVDAVTIRHLAPVGLDYDVCAERLRLECELQRRGLAQIADAHQTVQRWYPWRPLPPWIRELDHVDAG